MSGFFTRPYIPCFASGCISHLGSAGGEGWPRALFPPAPAAAGEFQATSALLPNLIFTAQSGIWDETHRIRVSNL